MYELTIAIHRGTITSRDVEQPQEFHTMEECIAALNAAKNCIVISVMLFGLQM